MELIKKEAAINTLPSFPCACGVTSLHHETFNDSMKECAIVVTLQAKLEEVAAGSWCLLGPKVNLNVSIVRLYSHSSCCWRFLLIDCRHYLINYNL
jgi:hypothetical protein